MNTVKLVCIASATAFGVEVQNIDGNIVKTMLVESITEQPNPLDIRAKLNQAIEKLGSEYTVVAPSKYKLIGAVTPEKAGLARDALHGYECMQVRDGWTHEAKKRARVAATVEQVLLMKTKTVGAIAVRNNAPTKASIVRTIIAVGLSNKSTTEHIVTEIVKATGFALSLARVYFKENLKKVYGPAVAEVAPEAVDAALALLEA
jgi:hypothetical protein